MAELISINDGQEEQHTDAKTNENRIRDTFLEQTSNT